MNIHTFIKSNIPEYNASQIELPFGFEEAVIEAKTILSPIGRVEEYMYFLKTGGVQVSTTKGEEERILEFVFPGHFFCAYTSFLLGEPSDVEVSTLTECEISIIKRQELMASLQHSLLASRLCQTIAEHLFLSRARREKDLLTKTAEERYRDLFDRAPDVIKSIPGNKIAKYLGIQAESLSRIRKSIIP